MHFAFALHNLMEGLFSGFFFLISHFDYKEEMHNWMGVLLLLKNVWIVDLHRGNLGYC
jgi:hypothetical protein